MVKWIQLLDGLTLQNEIIAGCLVAFNSLLAAAGGVGGGPIYTSILLAFGASVHSAIPIPQVIIFAGSVGLFIINAGQKMATNKMKPAIQWDLVFFLENSVVVGTIIGALLNLILPNWFLLGSEIIFFTYEGINSMVKGIKGIKADKKKFKHAKNMTMSEIMKAELQGTNIPGSEEQVDQSPLVEAADTDKLNSADTIKPIDFSTTSPLSGVPATEVPEKQKRKRRGAGFCIHWKAINVARICTFFAIFFVQMLLQVVRRFQKSCSVTYWLLFAMNIVIGAIAIVINDLLLHQSIKHNKNDLLLGVGIEKFKGVKQRVKLVCVGFFAGVIAATLGLGGGIIKQPLMLGIGVPPYLARLASQTMILFTSLTASVGFVAQGQVDFAQVWPFMIIAAVTFPIGFYLSDLVIKCVKSTQVINLSIAILLLISVIFVTIQFVKIVKEMVLTGIVEGFRIDKLCK